MGHEENFQLFLHSGVGWICIFGEVQLVKTLMAASYQTLIVENYVF